jgi:hypothetical protein
MGFSDDAVLELIFNPGKSYKCMDQSRYWNTIDNLEAQGLPLDSISASVDSNPSK